MCTHQTNTYLIPWARLVDLPGNQFRSEAKQSSASGYGKPQFAIENLEFAILANQLDLLSRCLNHTHVPPCRLSCRTIPSQYLSVDAIITVKLTVWKYSFPEPRVGVHYFTDTWD
jgi:hypothetical protein